MCGPQCLEVSRQPRITSTAGLNCFYGIHHLDKLVDEKRPTISKATNNECTHILHNIYIGPK